MRWAGFMGENGNWWEVAGLIIPPFHGPPGTNGNGMIGLLDPNPLNMLLKSLPGAAW